MHNSIKIIALAGDMSPSLGTDLRLLEWVCNVRQVGSWVSSAWTHLYSRIEKAVRAAMPEERGGEACWDSYFCWSTGLANAAVLDPTSEAWAPLVRVSGILECCCGVKKANYSLRCFLRIIPKNHNAHFSSTSSPLNPCLMISTLPGAG